MFAAMTVLILLGTMQLSGQVADTAGAARRTAPAADSSGLTDSLSKSPPAIVDSSFSGFHPAANSIRFKPPLFSNPLPPANAPGNPYTESLLNFQNTTAYDFEYSREVREEDNVRPEYGSRGVIVPVMPAVALAIYGMKKGIDAIQGDPPLSFDQTDVHILDLIWNEPDLTVADYYAAYNRHYYEEPLTYMTLLARLDNLIALNIISSREVEAGPVRYTARNNRQELDGRIVEILQQDPAAQRPQRLMELQLMQRLLIPAPLPE